MKDAFATEGEEDEEQKKLAASNPFDSHIHATEVRIAVFPEPAGPKTHLTGSTLESLPSSIQLMRSS
jgi:hypothetical protein